MTQKTPCQQHHECDCSEIVKASPDHLDPEAWFEDKNSGRDTEAGKRRRRALQACWTDCPMRARLECLNIGMAKDNLDHGIWGGYTEDQRLEMDDLIELRKAKVTA